MQTLGQQVDKLACRALCLESLAGDMLATIKLNFQRGLLASSEEAALTLAGLIEGWQRQLNEVTAKPVG